MASRTEELLPLTALRGIAAWWVVLFHLRLFLAPYLPAEAMAVLARGNLAVDLFFLLSGFVIYLNYAHRVTPDPESVGDFLFRRFARIYPLHLLVLAGFAAWYGAAVLLGASTLEAERPGYFLASLFLVQNWGFTDGLAWNVPAWSISTEIVAYALFPAFLLLLAPAKRRSATLVAALVLLAPAVQLFFRLFGYPFPDAVPQTGLFRCLVQFAMGMLLCELWRRWQGQKRLAAALFGMAALCAGAFVLAGAPVVPLAWAALILGLALAERGNPLGWRPLVWLGQVSYATYLCHYLALVVFKYLCVEEGRPVPPALLLAYLVSVLALSALLYHGFERPVQRWLLDWRRGRKAAAPVLAAAE
jgi:peptidoglycan/LPS O-acetylase OafA/YrhL